MVRFAYADVLIVVPMRWPLVLTVGAGAACCGGGAGGADCSAGLGAACTGSAWRGGGVDWTAALFEATELTAMMSSRDGGVQSMPLF